MGSDSSCCGPHDGPIRPEVDTTFLKGIQKNNQDRQPLSSKPIEQHYETDSKHNSTKTSKTKPSPSPNPSSQTPQPTEGKQRYQRSNNPKKKRRKRKYNKVSTQIEILCSENAKAQSLLLCSKPAKIHTDGTVKEFGFLKYLKTNLSNNAVSELFSKFPSKSNGEYNEHSLSCSQFVTLLTLVVIIYRVKLYQLRTGTKEKPPLNSEKIKTSVEHLSMWCIRTYGDKQNCRKPIKVYDDKGNEIKGEYYVFKFRLTQTNFSANIYAWLKTYVDREGEYPF